jgi:hypothetical protein
VHLCAYIAIAAASAKTSNVINTKDFKFENTFNQWIIALFSLMFGVICVLFYGWFKYYKHTKYQQTMILYAGFAIIEGVSIAIAFVFYVLLEVKEHIIWTSFVILPIVFGTFIFFMGNFISNDYFFYDEKKKGEPVEKKQDTTRVIDEGTAQNQVPAEDKNRLAEIAQETFLGELKKIICCVYLPRNRSNKDKM